MQGNKIKNNVRFIKTSTMSMEFADKEPYHLETEIFAKTVFKPADHHITGRLNYHRARMGIIPDKHHISGEKTLCNESTTDGSL